MEKNGNSGRMSTHSQAPRSDNIELEKFKRRLIRAVARMLLHEKRNEDEVWTGLKKETGCDCKELWNRMYALTIKKLSRLLEAQDRVDQLPRAARMSITDWLLFDTVLAHDDSLDVIGMTETSAEDRAVLVQLFALVEKYKLEFLAGDELADAWATATMEYNNDNRQCTPMLLQRRWYQLKLATRARFYKFWSMYKGFVKRLPFAEMYKPTPLQTEIAKRYKPLVIMPIMMWEDLVKNKLVILPEHFERRGLEKQKADENIPDVLCLEPNVETISLDEDSDSELEYRKPPPNTFIPAVSIKQEPRDIDEEEYDETVPYENRQEKISHFAEAVMKATAMELDQIDLNVDELTENVKDDEEMLLNEDNSVIQVPQDEGNIIADEVISTEVPVIALPTENNVAPDIDVIKQEVDDVDDNLTINDNTVETATESEIVLPQIASVFGGVDVSNETLSKIGMLTAEITNSKTIVTDEMTKSEKDPIPKEEISSDSIEDDDRIVKEDDSNQDSVVEGEKVDVNIKTESDTSKSSWFGELSNDIDFADDGIQLVDDGTAFKDDECANQMRKIKKEIITENDTEKPELATENEEDNVPKIDKKLLMVPQVKMVKLDDMGILPINLLQHVDDKNIIQIIDFKSKPIKPIIKQVDTIKPIIKEEDTTSESSEEESVTEEIKKVKLTSNLLQKPRSRSYNPIQLCKNPDFNTRLKRLSIGFFSSSRNCCLLKACKPLTIDVSKAFESRLSNGTMYLDVVKDETIPVKVDLTESSQNVSVVPSAMAVQSLIDNNDGIVNTVSHPPAVPNPVEVPTPVSERSKTINLPDITEIRRINQRLLTAEVTPLQVKNNIAQVPVSIVTSNIPDNVTTVETQSDVKRMPGPASRTKLLPKVVDITKDDVNNSNKTTQVTNSIKNKELPKTVIAPWKPKTKSEVPWINVSTHDVYSADTLLALDTLNKMLFVLTEDINKVLNIEQTKLKKIIKKKALIKGKPATQGNDDDVQVISETKKKGTPVYCCWSREKICRMLYHKKRLSKHTCPYPLCLCCCQQALNDCQRSEMEKLKAKRKKNNQNSTGAQIEKDSAQKNTHVHINEDISTEVAEIVPVVQKDSKATVVAKTVTTKEKQELDSSVNLIDQDVICSDEATLGEILVVSSDSTAKSMIDDKATSTEDHRVKKVAEDVTNSPKDVLMEAEVSIIEPKSTDSSSDESTNPTKNVNTTNLMTDMKPPPPPGRHRFRVQYAAGPVTQYAKRKIIHEQRIKVTSGKSQSSVIDPEYPVQSQNTTQKPGPSINVRKGLVVPPEHNTNGQNIHFNTDTSKTKSTQKSNTNQKMIYLNSKKISDRPSDSPIFLGNNKILLTTAKFPANFKAFDEFQHNIRQTMALPKGIQLLLQPNGRVTYKRDPKIKISDEFMATMPHLVEAIQQQIDSTVVSTTQASITTTQRQSEVINLIDDETPIETSENSPEDDSGNRNDQTKSTSNEDNVTTHIPEIQIDTETKAGSTDDSATESTDKQIEQNINISENITQQEQSMQLSNNVTEMGQNVLSENISNPTTIVGQAAINNTIEIGESIDTYTKGVGESTEIPKTKEIGKSVETSNTVHIGQSTQIHNTKEIENSTEITNTKNTEVSTGATNSKDTDRPKMVHLSTDPDVMTVDDDNELNINKDNNSGKTKNILSDLMAMSGIEPLDISQDSPVEPTTAQVPPVSDTLHLATPTISLVVPPQYLSNPSMVPVLSPNAAVPKTSPENSNTSQALTAITSLSELKYACAQNGLFFKLDLETGLLVPINVCMKKLEAQAKQSGVRRQLTKPLARRSIISLHKPVESGQLKSVIDLTDDDTPEEPSVSTPPVVHNSRLGHNELSQLKSLLISNQPQTIGVISLNKEGESTSEGVTAEDKSTIPQAKPLKLFKSVSRTSHLERKLKEIRQKISKAMVAKDKLRRQLKRKEELFKTLDPNPRVIDPNFGQLSIDGDSSDCSSDEEPLASVAIKMRATEKQSTKSRSLLKKRKIHPDKSMYNISEAKKKRAAVPNVVLHVIPDELTVPMPSLSTGLIPNAAPLPIPSISPVLVPTVALPVVDIAMCSAADLGHVRDEAMSASEHVDEHMNVLDEVQRPWNNPVATINVDLDPSIVPVACHMEDNENDNDDCILGV